MKKIFFIFLAVFLFIFLASVLINQAIIFLAKKQLHAVFKDSVVSIGSCRLNPVRQLSFFEVRIKEGQVYDFLVKEARIEYSLFSILKGRILKFSLTEARVYINLTQQDIAKFPQYLNLGSKSAFLVKSFEVSGLHLDLKARALNVSAILSAKVDLAGQTIDYLDLKIDSLGIQGFNLSRVSLKAAQDSPAGYFEIERMKYNKLNIFEAKSRIRLLGKELFLDNFSAKAFDGDIAGNINFALSQDSGYAGVLKFSDLDIAGFIDDFDLKDKFEMTGRLSGDLTFRGRNLEIEILDGRLSSLAPGGRLEIKDTRFLEQMAGETSQPLDLLVENFKDYHYNIGTIKLFLDNRNLILDAALDGETGKRNLNIVVHDFKLKKEGQ